MALDPWPDEALALPVSSAEPLKPGRQNSATKIAARSVDPGPAVAEIQQAQVATAKAGRTTVQGSKKPVAKQAKKNKRISKTARKKAAQR
ncbi:MAG: hypothetical protein M5R42_15870 [Rhodocyclaceae bacterium]|nr:hypothetical protein [Rhodocyclaceae bacterium]